MHVNSKERFSLQFCSKGLTDQIRQNNHSLTQHQHEQRRNTISDPPFSTGNVEAQCTCIGAWESGESVTRYACLTERGVVKCFTEFSQAWIKFYMGYTCFCSLHPQIALTVPSTAFFPFGKVLRWKSKQTIFQKLKLQFSSSTFLIFPYFSLYTHTHTHREFRGHAVSFSQDSKMHAKLCRSAIL